MATAATAAATPAPARVRSADSRELKGYRIELPVPHDRQAVEAGLRTRWTRWVSSLLTGTALVGAPTLLGTILGATVESVAEIGTLPIKVGGLLGFGFGAWVLSRVIHRLAIYVDEWSGYLTQDGFLGTMVAYGPGYHPSHWWEERNASRNQSLRAITKSYKVEVQTKSGPITVEGEVQYAATLAGLDRFIGVDVDVEKALVGLISTFLIDELSGGSVDDALKTAEGINDRLQEKFMGVEGVLNPTTGLKGTVTDLEETYGLVVVSVFVNHLDLPKEVEEARSALAEAEVLNGIVAKMLGIEVGELKERMKKDGDISLDDYKELLNRALAMSGNATMEIKTIDITRATAALAARFFGGGGPGDTARKNPKN